jgi:hypothetical protein
MADKCQFIACSRDAESRGWCGLHYMRWKRGSPMDGPPRQVRWSSHEALMESAIRFAEAESDDQYKRAWWALRRAAWNYAAVPSQDPVEMAT